MPRQRPPYPQIPLPDQPQARPLPTSPLPSLPPQHPWWVSHLLADYALSSDTLTPHHQVSLLLASDWWRGLSAVERMLARWSSGRGESNLRTHSPKFRTFPSKVARGLQPTPPSESNPGVGTPASPKAVTYPAHPTACTASFCVFFFYRPTGRPMRTSLPLECHRKRNRNHFGSSARHSTKA
jgi:hypothetical protein